MKVTIKNEHHLNELPVDLLVQPVLISVGTAGGRPTGDKQGPQYIKKAGHILVITSLRGYECQQVALRWECSQISSSVFEDSV